MEITRRTNNNNQLSRTNMLRDWGPLLVRLGKMALESTKQAKNSSYSPPDDGGSAFSTQSVRAGTKRRGQRRQRKPAVTRKEGVPKHLQTPVFETTLRGSIILQGTSGSYSGSFHIGYDITNNISHLVNDNNTLGNDFSILKNYGFLKYHKVSITIAPVLAATDSGYAMMGVRSIVDTTTTALPAYIRKMPGSIQWVMPQKRTLTYTPEVNEGIIHRNIQYETIESDIEHSHAGTFKVYMATASSATSAIIGILTFSIEVSAWND